MIAQLPEPEDRQPEQKLTPERDETYKGRKVPRKVSQQWREEAKEFIEKANNYHGQVGTLMSQALNYARDAGEYLEEAKRRIQGRKWGKFRDKYFNGSGPTAIVYMRIYNKWNDPRVRDIKTGELTVTSIKGFCDAVADSKPPETEFPETEPPDVSKDEQEREELLQATRDVFREFLKNKDLEDLRALDGVLRSLYRFISGNDRTDRDGRKLRSYELEALAGVLADIDGRLFKDLKRRACSYYETDFYGDIRRLFARPSAGRKRRTKSGG